MSFLILLPLLVTGVLVLFRFMMLDLILLIAGVLVFIWFLMSFLALLSLPVAGILVLLGFMMLDLSLALLILLNAGPLLRREFLRLGICSTQSAAGKQKSSQCYGTYRFFHCTLPPQLI